MQGVTAGSLLLMVLLVPSLGSAQPSRTAQAAEWQVLNEPILVNGLVYYPTMETRFFDRQIMTQTGVYLGVPVYADVTLEPHSVIYVPVSRGLMRGYERRREGELAGTQGSRVPYFPVEIPSGIAAPEPRTVTNPRAVGTSGAAPPAPSGDTPRPAATRIASIPLPRGDDGIWLEYAGARWYSDGPAVVFDEARFRQVGVYRGFPVYRDRASGAGEIWVRVVADGPVAPYTKR